MGRSKEPTPPVTEDEPKAADTDKRAAKEVMPVEEEPRTGGPRSTVGSRGTKRARPKAKPTSDRHPDEAAANPTTSDEGEMWSPDADRAGAPKVFLSYRHTSGTDVVTSLAARLRRDLGSVGVFRDADDLIGGELWLERVLDEVDASDMAVFLIGPDWSEDGERGRRIDNEDDPVRQEVEAALAPASSCLPVPVLLDGISPPQELPAAVAPLFNHHCIPLDRVDIGRRSSANYQRILVSAWCSIATRVEGHDGLLMIGDGSSDAAVEFDAFLAELRSKRGSRSVEIQELTRLGAGVSMLTVRRLRKAKKDWPGVIVFLGDDPTEEGLARVHAVFDNPRVRSVALVGTTAATTMLLSGAAPASGLAVSTYQGVGQLASAHLGNLSSWAVGAKSAWQGASVLAKASVVAPLALTVGLTTSAIIDDSEPLPSLAGSWNVEDFALSSEGDFIEGSFGDIAASSLTFDALDEGCTGAGCAVEITEGPSFLIGAQVIPGGDGLEAGLAFDGGEAAREISGGISCQSDPGVDISDLTSVFFSAAETDDVITFEVRIEIPATGNCEPGTLSWVSEATRT